MKIKIKREGGFIGITSKADIEFDQLTTEEQNAINSLTEKSVQVEKKTTEKNGLSKLKGRGLGTPESPTDDNDSVNSNNNMPHNGKTNMMRDAFSYSISMKKDGKTVSMKFDDMTAPPEIVEIFQKYVQY